MTVSYPKHSNKESYIEALTILYSQDYESYDSKILKIFIKEIVTRISNIIKNNTEEGKLEDSKLSKLKELLDEEDKIEIVSDSEDESLEECCLSANDELKLYVLADEIVIKVDLKRYQIPVEKIKNFNKFQEFISKATRKCIEEICAETLKKISDQQAELDEKRIFEFSEVDLSAHKNLDLSDGADSSNQSDSNKSSSDNESSPSNTPRDTYLPLTNSKSLV
jgi:hypothetical protein